MCVCICVCPRPCRRCCMIQALIHGLNRHYYSIVIDYRKNELEEQVIHKNNKNNKPHHLSIFSSSSSCIYVRHVYECIHTDVDEPA